MPAITLFASAMADDAKEKLTGPITFNTYEKFIFSTRQNVREDPWDVNVISRRSSHSHITFASNISSQPLNLARFIYPVRAGLTAHINHAYVSNQFATVHMQTMPLNLLPRSLEKRVAMGSYWVKFRQL